MKRSCLLALLMLVANVAAAQVPMTGRFVAEARCPALQSIRNQTNPGDVATEPGTAYALIGRNAEAASHYYVVIPNAEPPRRWVAVGCGRVEDDDGVDAADVTPSTDQSDGRGAVALAEALGRVKARRPEGDTPASEGQRSGPGRYVLAASWHAAFCETRPQARDCRDGGEDGGFMLHGLWPQPRGKVYCGVARRVAAMDKAGDWAALPPPRLRSQTRRALRMVMPGTVAALDRHQWIKHGSCYGADADEYFTDAIALMGQLNGSRVGRMFAENVGQRLDARVIRDAFDAAFGRGAGRRVSIDCARDGGRRIIVELRVHLAGTIMPQSDLGDLIGAADAARGGCRGGIVDAAGWQ